MGWKINLIAVIVALALFGGLILKVIPDIQEGVEIHKNSCIDKAKDICNTDNDCFEEVNKLCLEARGIRTPFGA